MKANLPLIKTVLTYVAFGLLFLAYFISVFKKIKIGYFKKRREQKTDLNGDLETTKTRVEEDYKSTLLGNNFTNGFTPKNQTRENIQVLNQKWHGKENEQNDEQKTKQKQEDFEELCNAIVEQKDILWAKYTPFFKFNESNNIQRFFLTSEKNELLTELFYFWQKGYRNASLSLLMLFYVIAIQVVNWQKFLSEILTWMQLPTIDRLVLEFLFQDILQEQVAWQYLYNQKTFIRNPSLRFNIELLLSERKWTKENFPTWPFSVENREQIDLENVSFTRLFEFVKIPLQKKCSTFFYRELYHQYANNDEQTMEKIFEAGRYSALKTLSYIPAWTEYFWNPSKKFPNGQIDIREFYQLQQKMDDLPFANHHLLFLLYRISPLHPLIQKINLDISFWSRENKFTNDTDSNKTSSKTNISFFLTFVEYLYALQKKQHSLAEKMSPFINTTDKRNIIFISRALSAGDQKQEALDIINKGLQTYPNDKQLLHEAIVCARHNQDEESVKKYRTQLA